MWSRMPFHSEGVENKSSSGSFVTKIQHHRQPDLRVCIYLSVSRFLCGCKLILERPATFAVIIAVAVACHSQPAVANRGHGSSRMIRADCCWVVGVWEEHCESEAGEVESVNQRAHVVVCSVLAMMLRSRCLAPQDNSLLSGAQP